MDVEHELLSIPVSNFPYIKIVRTIGHYRFHSYDCSGQRSFFKDPVPAYNDVKAAHEKGFVFCETCRDMIANKKLKRPLSWKQHDLTMILFISIPECSSPYEITGLNDYLMEIRPKLKELNINYVVFDEPEYGVISIERFLNDRPEDDDLYEFILTQEEMDFC